MSDMFIHTCTLLVRTKVGNAIVYKPQIIKNCFLTHKTTTVNDERGLRFVGIGKCVIPIKSLSSLDKVSPEESDPQSNKIIAGPDSALVNSYIALGVYENEQYTSSDVTTLPNCFCIQSVDKFNFSSLPVYVLSGV